MGMIDTPPPALPAPLLPLRPWQRVHWRVTLLYLLAAILVLTLNGVVLYWHGVDNERGALRDQLLITAVVLAQTLDGPTLLAQLDGPDAMASTAFARLQEQLRQICARSPDVTSIYIMRPTADTGRLRFVIDYAQRGQVARVGDDYDARGVPLLLEGLRHPVVETNPVADAYGLTLSGYAPLRNAEGETLAVVGVDVDASSLDEIRQRVLRFLLILAGLMVLLMLLAALFVGRLLREPLRRVVEGADRVARGDFRVRLATERRDEFGLLSGHFNRMVQGLIERDFIRETFGRYVSRDVATALLANPEALALGGQEREVSVLFSDLREYSTLSEELSPTDILSLLNEYLGVMNAVIDEHRGCVIEYLGDGILVAFNAPNEVPDHASAAVRCALHMQEELAALNLAWRQRGKQVQTWSGTSLAMRIGIHSGRVVAGNLGSHSRTKYAVIGDNVNVAARLEQLNKELGTAILISEDVYRNLPCELLERTRDLGDLAVKGRRHPVRVFACA